MANGVILDTNCFSHVFNRSDSKHAEFSFFLNWLCKGPGFLIYGGTKYNEELKRAKNYLKIFSILHQINKADEYDTILIDEEMDRVSNLVKKDDFDDPHLAAISIVSKCCVICTSDSRSFQYLKRKDLYKGRSLCPKFYTGDSCNHLLSRRYIGFPRHLRKQEVERLFNQVQQIS